MKIALLSDTHDNLVAVDQVLKLLKKRKIGTVIHCGDLVAPFTLMRFKEDYDGQFYFVFGNNDGEKVGLMRIAETSQGKIVCLGNEGEIEIDGKNIFCTHESLIAILVAKSGEYDFCFGGHDHRQRKEVFAKTIFVNPGNLTTKRDGELYKSADHCLVLVDLQNGEVERIDL